MKKLIIRKPKFMRNEALMQQFIERAQDIQKQIKSCESPLDSQYIDLWDTWWHHIGAAAKAGGFFNVDSFLEWAKERNINLM